MKNVENNIPDHLYLSVIHLHPGNSTRKQRHGSDYQTIARLFDKDNQAVYTGISRTSKEKDQPTRRVGRYVAIGRALKNYRKGVAEFVCTAA